MSKLPSTSLMLNKASCLAGNAINYAFQMNPAHLLLHHKVVKFVDGWHMLPEAFHGRGCRLALAEHLMEHTSLCIIAIDTDEDMCYRLATPRLMIPDRMWWPLCPITP